MRNRYVHKDTVDEEEGQEEEPHMDEDDRRAWELMRMQDDERDEEDVMALTRRLVRHRSDSEGDQERSASPESSPKGLSVFVCVCVYVFGR